MRDNVLDAEQSTGEHLEYRRLAEAIPALIWLTNAQGRTLYANRQWFDFTGVDIAGLEPQAFEELIHENDRAAVRAAWEGVADGSGTIDVEYRLRYHDGTFRWIVAHAIPLRDDDGTLRQWLGAGIDIDDQKRGAEYTQRVMAAVPQIVFTSDALGNVEYYNRRWYELTGLTPEESLGEGWTGAVHPDDVAQLAEVWSRARGRDAPFAAEYRLRRASDNTYRWHVVTSQAVRDSGGNIVRWIGVATDIDDQKRRESVLLFLAASSELLAESFDVDRRMQAVADRAVPEIADWCGIYLVRNGALEPVAIAHRDPERVRLAHQLIRQYPIETDDRVMGLLRAGKTIFMPVIPDSALREAARDEHHLTLMRQLQMRSSVQVPLHFNGQAFGFIHCVNGISGRIYDREDVQTIEILAKRISIAIDNARIYERERRVANTFQQAALPRTLPELPGINLSAFYQPAMSEAEIGGDWYDAFVVAGRTLMLSIGDVSGKGLDAAVMMSNVRQAIRVAALEELDVRRIVAAADKALQLEYPGHVVTALVISIDLLTLDVQYVNAGHPPALARGSGRECREFDVTNAPLGIMLEREDAVGHERLDRNGLLVLYTDGLIEASRDILEGTARLREAFLAEATLHTPNPARLLFEALLRGGARDDVAILGVAFGRNRHWSLDASDAVRAQSARSSFVRHLREEGTPESDYAGAEVIFGELVGNVVRYSPGRVDIDLEWNDESPVLHILDRGEEFTLRPLLPDDLLSETGRGLFIVGTLGEQLAVRSVPGGGNHVSVRLPVRRLLEAHA